MWRTFYLRFVQGSSWIRHPFLLALRIYFGAQLIVIGAQKLTNLGQIASFFEGVGVPIPYITAAAVGLIELVGGVSLVLGYLSRFFALALTCIFIAAFAIAHPEVLSDHSEFIKASPFLFLVTSLMVLSFGPGFFSFDYWLEKKKYGKPL